MRIEPRQWDSELTHLSCGTLVQDSSTWPEFDGWDHVIAVVKVGDPITRKLESASFHLVSTRIDFESGPYAFGSTGTHAYPLRTPRRDDVERLSKAHLRFRGSRFHADPMLAPYADDVHRRWVSTLVSRGALMVCDHGFISLERDGEDMRIPLIASYESAPHGIGKLMMAQLSRMPAFEPQLKLRVKTQVNNFPACRLYYGCGLKPYGIECVYAWSRP